MTTPIKISFTDQTLEALENNTSNVVIFVREGGRMDTAARKVNTLTRRAVLRFVESDAFEKAKNGDVMHLNFPAGMAARAVIVVKLAERPSVAELRKAGAALVKSAVDRDLLVLAGQVKDAHELAFGVAMRAYDYNELKTGDKKPFGAVSVAVKSAEEAQAAYAPQDAVVAGAFFTRDLTNKPANVLTTTTFAEELVALESLGVKVEVLEESDMAKLGMGSLLCVGQGSDSPSKMVVMQWNGGGDEAPFAFVGKGVVFDTGGISIKPAAGMEEMTMDMGGAGVVAGVMKTLALRKAKANVVGLVGLVENMPSGNATRPGDIVKSMKGDTIEVINTDAEGRLVLADVLWYTQDRFKPVGMVNLATLTGAIIIALGHEKAGLFSNSDTLCGQITKAADIEGEGAWRLPLDPAYDAQLKSDKADMKNVGTRAAGSITAAQFLQRFVKDDVPWCHIDIAGTAQTNKDTALAPKGATGWGVMTLNRLIADHYES